MITRGVKIRSGEERCLSGSWAWEREEKGVFPKSLNACLLCFLPNTQVSNETFLIKFPKLNLFCPQQCWWMISFWAGSKQLGGCLADSQGQPTTDIHPKCCLGISNCSLCNAFVPQSLLQKLNFFELQKDNVLLNSKWKVHRNSYSSLIKIQNTQCQESRVMFIYSLCNNKNWCSAKKLQFQVSLMLQ